MNTDSLLVKCIAEMRRPNSLYVSHCAVLNATLTRSFSYESEMYCTSLHSVYMGH